MIRGTPKLSAARRAVTNRERIRLFIYQAVIACLERRGGVGGRVKNRSCSAPLTFVHMRRRYVKTRANISRSSSRHVKQVIRVRDVRTRFPPTCLCVDTCRPRRARVLGLLVHARNGEKRRGREKRGKKETAERRRAIRRTRGAKKESVADSSKCQQSIVRVNENA